MSIADQGKKHPVRDRRMGLRPWKGSGNGGHANATRRTIPLVLLVPHPLMRAYGARVDRSGHWGGGAAGVAGAAGLVLILCIWCAEALDL